MKTDLARRSLYMMLKAKKTFFVSIGVICLSIGVLGLVLPIIPGIVFILLGFYLMAKVYPVAMEKVREWGRKVPLIGPVLKRHYF